MGRVRTSRRRTSKNKEYKKGVWTSKHNFRCFHVLVRAYVHTFLHKPIYLLLFIIFSWIQNADPETLTRYKTILPVSQAWGSRSWWSRTKIFQAWDNSTARLAPGTLLTRRPSPRTRHQSCIREGMDSHLKGWRYRYQTRNHRMWPSR